MFQRRVLAIDTAADSLKQKIRALDETQNGSEITEQELGESQHLFTAMQEKTDALKLMAETAAQAYESETGERYTPVTGDCTTACAMESGTVFEAKKLLVQADRDTALAIASTKPRSP